MTKRELIQFMDELVELASEENKTRAILVKEKFINDFEKSYEYEKEVQTEITELPPYYIAAMPDLIQEEIKAKVIAEHGYNLEVTEIVFVGGGANVVKRFGNYDGNNIQYIEDVKANAKGYEYLGKLYLATHKKEFGLG